MDLSFITELYMPIIVVACLIVGYIIKKWVKDVENKWIPTIVTVLGLILGGILTGCTVESLVAGALSGLASTGLHQLFSQIIEGKDKLDN
jgi:Na+/glutamate symporter